MLPSTDVTENRRSAREIKFLIDPSRAQEIRDWARAHLGPDPNANQEAGDAYHISSLYFDTRNFDIFHRRGSFGRSKYRVRQYDLGEGVFLERKLRTSDLVSKRRTKVPIEEVGRLESLEPDVDWAGYWFHRRLLARELKPVCQISYLRTARVSGTNAGLIRLTLDQDIRALSIHSITFDHSQLGQSLSEHHWVLELKYTGRLPALFRQLLTRFALSPQAVSKYRMAAAALGCVAESLPGEIAQAPRAQIYV
jgi:SPX domain protein involved in polyphosphate accumulation